MKSRPQIDVLGLGCAAVDDILFVDDYPPADAKVRVRKRERQCGGLTATALVAAARLGVQCAFAGTLGLDPDSEFVLEALRAEGVRTDLAVRRRGAGPVRSVVVVDSRQRTRNVFADLSGVRGADPKRPAAEVIRRAGVLLIDHFGLVGNLRAACLARRAGVPVVSDLEHPGEGDLQPLLAQIDHPIFSQRMAETLTGRRQPDQALARLVADHYDTVIVTCGAKGAWFWHHQDRRVRHYPAFRVKAVDTTGCGDVFHGAYAAALVRGLGVEERVRVASAAAALKAAQSGGQAGAPTWRELQKFLRAGLDTQRMRP